MRLPLDDPGHDVPRNDPRCSPLYLVLFGSDRSRKQPILISSSVYSHFERVCLQLSGTLPLGYSGSRKRGWTDASPRAHRLELDRLHLAPTLRFLLVASGSNRFDRPIPSQGIAAGERKGARNFRVLGRLCYGIHILRAYLGAANSHALIGCHARARIGSRDHTPVVTAGGSLGFWTDARPVERR